MNRSGIIFLALVWMIAWRGVSQGAVPTPPPFDASREPAESVQVLSLWAAAEIADIYGNPAESEPVAGDMGQIIALTLPLLHEREYFDWVADSVCDHLVRRKRSVAGGNRDRGRPGFYLETYGRSIDYIIKTRATRSDARRLAAELDHHAETVVERVIENLSSAPSIEFNLAPPPFTEKQSWIRDVYTAIPESSDTARDAMLAGHLVSEIVYGARSYTFGMKQGVLNIFTYGLYAERMANQTGDPSERALALMPNFEITGPVVLPLESRGRWRRGILPPALGAYLGEKNSASSYTIPAAKNDSQATPEFWTLQNPTLLRAIHEVDHARYASEVEAPLGELADIMRIME